MKTLTITMTVLLITQAISSACRLNKDQQERLLFSSMFGAILGILIF